MSAVGGRRCPHVPGATRSGYGECVDVGLHAVTADAVFAALSQGDMTRIVFCLKAKPELANARDARDTAGNFILHNRRFSRASSPAGSIAIARVSVVSTFERRPASRRDQPRSLAYRCRVDNGRTHRTRCWRGVIRAKAPRRLLDTPAAAVIIGPVPGLPVGACPVSGDLCTRRALKTAPPRQWAPLQTTTGQWIPISKKGGDMYPVGKHMRASALVTLTVCAFACLRADTALAQTWRLTGPPAFVPVPGESIFLPGTSRKYASGEGLVTTTLNSRSAGSAAFTTTHERYGTSSISYSWNAPPEILHTGDVVAFNIRWNIGQKYSRFSPQMGSLTHLDWSTDWYTTQCYGELCAAPLTSGQVSNTVITVTSNNATQLVFYVDVHSTPGAVRVQWTYRRVDADVPASPSTPGGATTAPGYPHVVATAEGNLQPAPGYRWASDAANDRRVIWNPGSRHPRYTNVVAGTAEGSWNPAIDWDTDRPGSDLASFDLTADDPLLCLKACAAEPACKAWTYVKPGVRGTAPRCWLKSAIPPKSSNDCCASGVK